MDELLDDVEHNINEKDLAEAHQGLMVVKLHLHSSPATTLERYKKLHAQYQTLMKQSLLTPQCNPHLTTPPPNTSVEILQHAHSQLIESVHVNNHTQQQLAIQRETLQSLQPKVRQTNEHLTNSNTLLNKMRSVFY